MLRVFFWLISLFPASNEPAALGGGGPEGAQERRGEVEVAVESLRLPQVARKALHADAEEGALPFFLEGLTPTLAECLAPRRGTTCPRILESRSMRSGCVICHWAMK